MSIESTIQLNSTKARYNITRNLSLLTFLLLLLTGTIFIFQGDSTGYYNLTGGLIALSTFIITIRTQKHKWAGLICLSLLTILTVFNLQLSSNFYHFGDFIWAICVITTAFFLLGKNWGILFLILNFLIIFSIFYLIRNGHLIQIKKPYTSFSQINFLINMTVGGTLFTFLIVQFHKENRIIANNYLAINEKLKIHNAEKTVMLKEIHHRVKNNLQIVTSLLRLQKNEQEDEKITVEFSKAIDRISAMAKIHDKMYNNESLNKISLTDYLTDLISELILTYNYKNTIDIDIKNSTVDYIPLKLLVPLALLFNELVTNSLKHAFKDIVNGEIKIHLKNKDGNRVEITYFDNGKWVEPDTERNSIGLDLIDSFVDQIDGKYDLEKMDTGTRFTILFESIED